MLTELSGPAARAAPQFARCAAGCEHRCHLCPEPRRPAHACRSARGRRGAVPQRRPECLGRGGYRPAAPPCCCPRHPPGLPAVTADSLVFGGQPGHTHPAILPRRTGLGPAAAAERSERRGKRRWLAVSTGHSLARTARRTPGYPGDHPCPPKDAAVHSHKDKDQSMLQGGAPGVRQERCAEAELHRVAHDRERREGNIQRSGSRAAGEIPGAPCPRYQPPRSHQADACCREAR